MYSLVLALLLFTPDGPAPPCAATSHAAGAPGVLRTVQFARGETDEGLDVQSPVVEGELVVNRHPARGEFSAVVELQVREARRVAFCPE
jgi:hypothetical protein